MKSKHVVKVKNMNTNKHTFSKSFTTYDVAKSQAINLYNALPRDYKVFIGGKELINKGFNL